MAEHQKLLTVARVMELEKRLSQIPEVATFDVQGEPQGHTIAHALRGWEDSFVTFLDELLPRLLTEKASIEDLTDTLHDIGDELRHILYHIHDTKCFGYLLDDGD